MRNRIIKDQIKDRSEKDTGRIIVLTGARQTGKTTLARKVFGDYTYISIEDPVLRSTYSAMNAGQWKSLYPRAILDEVQKEPSLIESIKSVYDQWEEPRYVLLGSSQLLLLQKVKESLAGRVSIYEIFPLTLPELSTHSWTDEVKKSLFTRLLTEDDLPEILPSWLLDQEMPKKQSAWDHYNKYGGYPALCNDNLTEEERHSWLNNYVHTYLERDVRDLANFRDLEPFIKLQKLLAANTSTLFNASESARRIGLNSKTAQRYLQYFEMSYQLFMLPAWAGNLNKRLSKMNKIHFMDYGVLQAVLQKRGRMTGNEFESALVTEMYKQIKNYQIRAEMFHLRTHDGKEVDLLIEQEDGFYAFEIKQSEKIDISDARHLRGLESLLNKPLKKSFILSADPRTQLFHDGNVIAVHFTMFLG